jgi:hypothetical protein
LNLFFDYTLSDVYASICLVQKKFFLIRSFLVIKIRPGLNGINHTFPDMVSFPKRRPMLNLTHPMLAPHNIHSPIPSILHPPFANFTYAIGLLLSSSGILIYASIAAENTAKPAHPTTTACGPAFLARIPPVRHPPATPLYKSFLARKPSMAHSVPENMAPTLAKFLPLDLEDWYMSRRPALSCWRMGRSVRGMAAAPPVGFNTTEGPAAGVVEALTTLEAVGIEGFAFAVADATAVAVGPFGAGGAAFTGRGWDIGVS